MNDRLRNGWIRIQTSPLPVRWVLFILMIIVSIGLTACGKKGDPIPPAGT